MPSEALRGLAFRLADVDELIEARDAICPSGAGRPARRKGAAVLRGATVLLAAVFEGFVEGLFDEAVDHLYANVADSKREELKRDTSERLNNASVFKTNRLFFNIGISWIMDDSRLCWQKYGNAKVQAMLDALVSRRNKIAHGGTPSVRRTSVVEWRKGIARLAERLDEVVRSSLETRTGVSPW